VLYTLPSTAHFRFGVKLAKAALGKGFSVRIFAWGDSVYGITSGSKSGYSEDLAPLVGDSSGNEGPIVIDVCTTCCKLRGISENDLLPCAHLSGLHKIAEMFHTCDKMVAMIP